MRSFAFLFFQRFRGSVSKHEVWIECDIWWRRSIRRRCLMNIATAVTNDGQLLVERRTDSCKIVPIQARETFSIYRDGLLCERLIGTYAAARNRIVALSNCYPEHDWQFE